jgi:GNAT superfamily N-acetyltransferase
VIEIRPATDADLTAVARLRWQWVTEKQGPSPSGDEDEFVREFTQWARQHTESHRCVVAVHANAVIGMGWLAILQRVPTPQALTRASGDVQCVYVTPEHRDGGVGGQVIDALLDFARELGLIRVTVHSSSRAVSAYERHGFTMSRQLLAADTR